MRFLHNKTDTEKIYSGLTLPAEGVIQIQPEMYGELSRNQVLLSDIMEETVSASVDGENEYLPNTSYALISNVWNSSLAVDKDGDNQNLTTNDWVELVASRILWDIREDYSLENNEITIPHTGVYFFDGQFKFTNFVNVTSVELAIFKRGSPDDYWFILDKKFVDGNDELNLSGATFFDLYEGDKYCLKARLVKTLPLVGCSAVLSGDDDYTAWGFNFTRPLE